jgi:hypothetical protein
VAEFVIIDIEPLIEPEFFVQRKGSHKSAGHISSGFEVFRKCKKVLMDNKKAVLMHTMIERGYAQQDIGVRRERGGCVGEGPGE